MDVSPAWLGREGERVAAPIIRVNDLGESGAQRYVEVTVRTVADVEATFRTYLPPGDASRPGDTITVLYVRDDPSLAVAY